MIRILHSADWHLDSPLQQRGDQATFLRSEQMKIPGKLASLCQEKACDLVLLSGDLFDGAYAADTCRILKQALEQMQVPVFITPGNHDFIGQDSPWLQETWPENVHIFTHPVIESIPLPELDCRVYGASFISMDCPGLLDGFSAEQEEAYAIGILHGDPTQVSSPYCPVTNQQVQQSNLNYLALGHIHKGGSFTAGKTLCAWPGTPMGRGYDEEGEKGVLIVTIDDSVTTEFIPLDTPRFYDLEVEAGEDAAAALSKVLSPVGNEDFYRVTLTGPSQAIDLAQLQAEFSRFPNLVLRDRTTPPLDIWGTAGQDSFEGMYFGLLKDALEDADEDSKPLVRLAAELSRKLMDGQEVVLP